MKLFLVIKVKFRKGGYVLKIKHLFFAIVFFSFWLTGCANGSDEVEVNQNDFPPSMLGFVNVNGKEYEMKAGNYSWERKKGLETEVVVTDAASPYQIGKEFSAISLEPNTNINIEIEENPKLSVYLWNENGRGEEIILKNNQFTAPTNKGEYIYEVLAEWSNGEVSYTFVVEVN